MVKTSKRKHKVLKSILLHKNATGRYYGISGGPKIKSTKVKRVEITQNNWKSLFFEAVEESVNHATGN